jgi:hypothetical protein
VAYTFVTPFRNPNPPKSALTLEPLIGNTVKSDNDTPTNASCTLTDRDPPPETAPPPEV